jgi:hypothetical protein
MADQPEVMQMREVRGYLTARLPDGADADEDLDRRLLQGRVTFHPQYRTPLVYPGELIVLPEPVPARVVDGHILYEAILGEETVLQPVRLPVTADGRANQGWHWRLSFDLLRLGEYGEELPQWPDMRFPIEPGTDPLDLSEVSGEWKGGGLITRGPAGPGLTDVTAEGREVTFHWDGGGSRTLTLPELTGRDEDGRLHSTPVGIEGITEDKGDVVMTSTDVQVIMNYLAYQGEQLDALNRGTGTRNITSLVSDATGGQVLISRRGPFVELALVNLLMSGAAAWSQLLTLPVGFRPALAAAEAALIPQGSSSGVISVRRSDGRVDINRLGPTVRHKVTFVYMTGDDWPTTLPGTPA